VFVDPFWRVSEEGIGCLVKPFLQALYIFEGVILELFTQKFLKDSCLALRSSDLYRFLRALTLWGPRNEIKEKTLHFIRKQISIPYKLSYHKRQKKYILLGLQKFLKIDFL